MPPRKRATPAKPATEVVEPLEATAISDPSPSDSPPPPTPEPTPANGSVWVPVPPTTDRQVCPVCFPAGPAAGATCVGCEHGTWRLDPGQ